MFEYKVQGGAGWKKADPLLLVVMAMVGPGVLCIEIEKG